MFVRSSGLKAASESIDHKFNLDQYLNHIETLIHSILDRPSRKNAEFDLLSIPSEQKILNSALHLKQIQMKYGEIWQTVLGEYDGFVNLKSGHPSGLDIMCPSRKIVIELKNSYNTDNASSRRSNLDKLAAFVKKNKEYTAIYGIINEKHCKKREKDIEDDMENDSNNEIVYERNEGTVKTILHNDVDILYYSGKRLFDFLLGDDAPIVVNKVINVVRDYKLKKYMI